MWVQIALKQAAVVVVGRATTPGLPPGSVTATAWPTGMSASVASARRAGAPPELSRPTAPLDGRRRVAGEPASGAAAAAAPAAPASSSRRVTWDHRSYV